MLRTLILSGTLIAAGTPQAMASYPGYPQRVYRGVTYLIQEPRPTVSMWYAGDGHVRHGAERSTTFRRTTRTTAKKYYVEK